MKKKAIRSDLERSHKTKALMIKQVEKARRTDRTGSATVTALWQARSIWDTNAIKVTKQETKYTDAS